MLIYFLLYGYMRFILRPSQIACGSNKFIKKKEAYAASIDGPKIVIVAGSSGLFGLSASMMEEHFNIPTVNMATHGDLRDYYFSRAKRTLKPGDLVILAPEYTQYFFNSSMSNIKADYIVNFDKASLKNLPFIEQLEILKSYVHPWGLVKSGFLSLFRSRRGNIGSCSSKNLNRNGDVTSNLGSPKHIDRNVYIPMHFVPDKYVLVKMLNFISWCRNQNITVLVTWPGTIQFKERAKSDPYRFFNPLIAYLKQLGIEVLGRPDDFIVPRSYLYDTVYHLNSEGVAFRTFKTIEFLEKSKIFTFWQNRMKGCFSDVSYDSPEIYYANIAFNGTMEAAKNGLVDGWFPVTEDLGGVCGDARWDNTQSHSGSYSLNLTNISGRQVRWVGKKIHLPEATDRVAIQAWSKSAGVCDSAHYCVNIRSIFKDGSYSWNTKGLHFKKGTQDWNKVETIINFDRKVVSIQPYMLLYGANGSAWFDDFSIMLPR